MTEAFDVVVLAGGDETLGIAALEGHDFGPATTVVAADSGVALADAVGLELHRVVGDFDSLDAARVRALESDPSVDVRRYPSDKDASDLELALDSVLDEPRARRVLVAGVEGGRADYALGNILLVAAPRYRRLEMTVALAGWRAHVVHERLELPVVAGSLLSLLPVHGPATVSIDGVRWPLRRQTLSPGTSWGMSNEITATAISLEVHSGTAVAFVLGRT